MRGRWLEQAVDVLAVDHDGPHIAIPEDQGHGHPDGELEGFAADDLAATGVDDIDVLGFVRVVEVVLGDLTTVGAEAASDVDPFELLVPEQATDRLAVENTETELGDPRAAGLFGERLPGLARDIVVVDRADHAAAFDPEEHQTTGVHDRPDAAGAARLARRALADVWGDVGFARWEVADLAVFGVAAGRGLSLVEPQVEE